MLSLISYLFGVVRDVGNDFWESLVCLSSAYSHLDTNNELTYIFSRNVTDLFIVVPNFSYVISEVTLKENNTHTHA